MKTLITSFLNEQGLNNKDIQVYLDIYKYGRSFASSIAARTGIDRTTVYSVLKRLLKKSLIIRTKIHNTHVYIVVSPKVFIDKIDREIEEYKTKKKSAFLFIEAMSKIQQRSFLKPHTKIFEGNDAIKNLYLQTLENSGTQKSFLTIKRIPEFLKEFLKTEFMHIKVKKNVFSKVLVADTPFAYKYKNLDSKANRETKIIKRHPFELHAEIILCPKNEIAIIDFREDIYGLLIESETLYKTMETLFDYIWASESAY